MIDDSLQHDTGLQTIPTDEINYVRSAVKATVDAYDGTVNLYAWDEEDPILKTWMERLPGHGPAEVDIPDDLMEHLRYPEDLFKVQRYQLARYHVTNADDFYQGRRAVGGPARPGQATSSQQPPYRLFAQQHRRRQRLVAHLGLRAARQQNLASYISVNSDATSEEFGQIELLEMTDPKRTGSGHRSTTR